MEWISYKECLNNLFKSMSECMKNAMDEDPNSSKWTPEEVFKKGAEWAGRHVQVTEGDKEK